MPDPFCTLPLPLPLMIFEAIEDLSTLSYLLEASPSAAIIFRQHYCEVTEAVLDRLPLHMQRLLRTIVAIQSNRLVIRDRVNSFEEPSQWRVPNIVSTIKATRLLTKATHSFAAVRSLISSAGQVQRLSKCFFDTVLARVNSVRPYRIADERYRYRDYPKEPPERLPYQPLHCGPTSWVEEQRVLRALWRLQLYFCLVRIVEDGGGTDGIARNACLIEGPHNIWKGRAAFHMDQLDCVYEFLVEKETSTAPLSKLPSVTSRFVTTPQRPPKHTVVHCRWEQTHIYFRDWPGPGASYFSGLGIYHYSPLHGADFKPLSRLGMGIWDRKRMVRLGLVNVRQVGAWECNGHADSGTTSDLLPSGQSISHDDLICRWKSIERRRRKTCWATIELSRKTQQAQLPGLAIP